MTLLPAFIQTELVTSEKMDPASSLLPENLTKVTTTEPLPASVIYDPIWAMILRWTLGTIIVTVGMHLSKAFDCTFNRLVLALIRHLRTTLIIYVFPNALTTIANCFAFF